MREIMLLFALFVGSHAAEAARPSPTPTPEVFVRSAPIRSTRLPNENHPLVVHDNGFVRIEWSDLLKTVQETLIEEGTPKTLHAVLLVNGEVVPFPSTQSFTFVPETPGRQQDYYVEFRDAHETVVHRTDLVLKESHNAQVVPAEAFRAAAIDHPFSVELPASLHERGLTEALTATAIRLGYEKIVWVLAPGADPIVRDLVRDHSGDVDILPEFNARGEATSASVRQISTGNWLAVSVAPSNFFFKVDAAFNGNCFFWDDMFVSLATVPHDPWLARSTVEFWLAVQKMNGGVIPREVRKENLKSLWFPDVVRAGAPTVPNLEYTNPYLMHRVAAELYRWDPSAANRELLGRVATSAEVYARWIEEHRSFRDKHGEIIGFVTNGLGSGGDDSRGGRGNDHAPPAFRAGWTDLLAQMSDVWKSVAGLRTRIGQKKGVAEALRKADLYDRLLNEDYWDSRRGFYLDLVTDARGNLGPDTRHISIFGFWPLLSKSVSPERIVALADKVLDPHQFGGNFPLPANSRDQIPYDDVEEDGYWGKWSHWPSMASAVIDGFAENGQQNLATQLTIDFLRGMQTASLKTVYEFYGETRRSREDSTDVTARPGQHRNHVTRADFAGWGKVPPVRDLLAQVVGFRPTPDGVPTWNLRVPLRDGESFILRNLVIGGERRPELRLTRQGNQLVITGENSLKVLLNAPFIAPD